MTTLVQKIELFLGVLVCAVFLIAFVSMSYKIDFLLTLEMAGAGAVAILVVVLVAKSENRENRSGDRVVVIEREREYPERRQQSDNYPRRNIFGQIIREKDRREPTEIILGKNPRRDERNVFFPGPNPNYDRNIRRANETFYGKKKKVRFF